MNKVLLVTNPHCGGAERMTVLFGKSLLKQGYEIEILICKQHEKEECEIVSFIPDQFHVSYTTGRYRTLVFRLFSFLRKNTANYVFTSLPLLYHLLIPLIKLFFRKKRIIVRECNTPSRHSDIIKKKNKMVLPYADAIISQTDEMSKEMVQIYGLCPDSITTIINPVDEELINDKIKIPYEFPKGYTIYVAVGRIQPQKDYETLIQAFAKVLQIKPMSLLYIVGNDDGDYAIEQKKLVNKMGLQNKVIFVGFQKNPYKYMVGSDCYVLSSEYEGLPNTLLEAMYLNLPVVVTASIPFIPSLISGYPNGRCVPVKDVEAFAQSMLDICDACRHHKKNTADFQQTNLEPLFNLFQ